MKKVKDSRKRWKQLVTMLLVTALLVTGTPDIVGLASEGTQEQVTTAADQSEGTQAEGQAEAAQEEEEDEPTTRKKKKETETVSERESKKSKSTKTGDNNPIVMWIAIGAVAALVIIFLIVKRRKSE